ncbi:MAG TPA: hypothetical protein P5249_04585 [Smithellaceae bacterium]|nr:hypothetical protein [Smithellaceae bacterium]HOG82455.1 hypothetical protein [Smithellaceae bacterium]HRY35164.1 hypothetical protein [Smithellaceae bacterium]
MIERLPGQHLIVPFYLNGKIAFPFFTVPAPGFIIDITFSLFKEYLYFPVPIMMISVKPGFGNQDRLPGMGIRPNQICHENRNHSERNQHNSQESDHLFEPTLTGSAKNFS